MNKMMKILVAVFAVVLSLNLIGCGGDDSSDPGPNPDPTCTGGRTYNGTECVCPVGTWNGTSCVVQDNENPTVTLTDPSDSTTVSGTILVAATASDNIGIDRVEFKYGDNLICTDNAPPYECSWNTNAVSDGDYSVAAHAYDQAGNTASNHAVVTVRNTVDVCAQWRSDLDGQLIKEIPSFYGPRLGYLELFVDVGVCWVWAREDSGSSVAYSKATDVQYTSPPQPDGLVTMPWGWQSGTVTFKFR